MLSLLSGQEGLHEKQARHTRVSLVNDDTIAVLPEKPEQTPSHLAGCFFRQFLP